MSRAPLVTVFTDASYCQMTRVAGFAAGWKVDGQATVVSGALRGTYPHVSAAEAAAIANVVHMIGKRHPGARLIVQSDSTAAIGLLSQGHSPRKHQALMHGIRDAFTAAVARHRLTVEFRHVPGHRGGKAADGTADPRSYVNEIMDRHAKAAMRTARAQARRQESSDAQVEQHEAPRDRGQDQGTARGARNEHAGAG